MAHYSSASTDLGMRPYRSIAGPPHIQYFQISTATGGSSKVIHAGQIVSFDTVAASASHRIVVAPSSGGTGANLLQTTNVLGIALETSTSDGSTTGIGTPAQTIGVCLATPNQEFVGYLRGDLPSHSSIVGLTRAVIWDSTRQIFNIDSTNSTAALANVVITGVPEESTVGDTNGPVIFKFLSTQTSPVLGRGAA
jgi:hypothetical protein